MNDVLPDPLPHSKAAFARPRPDLTTVRRADFTVRIARSRLRHSPHEQAVRDRSRSSAPSDPAAPPSLKLRRAGIAESSSTRLTEIKRRFTICKTCQHSRDAGFACALYKGCCFGRWRSKPANRCLDNRW